MEKNAVNPKGAHTLKIALQAYVAICFILFITALVMIRPDHGPAFSQKAHETKNTQKHEPVLKPVSFQP